MDTVAVIEKGIADLKRCTEITRDIRFQANLRLLRRHRASTFMVSLLSMYVIGLSLLPNMIALQSYQSQILLSCSVLLSVFVIFTSLLDGARNFYRHGELLHHCARKVGVIHQKLILIDPHAEDPAVVLREIVKLQEEYQAALSECPVNHDNVDFWKEVGDKPHLFPGHCRGFLRRLWVPSYFRIKAVVGSNAWMLPHLAALAAVTWIAFHFILATATFPRASSDGARPLPGIGCTTADTIRYTACTSAEVRARPAQQPITPRTP